jgi:hypothetical protein
VVESSDDDVMARGGTAFQKVKRELKGVLASKVSGEPLQGMVIDGKLSQLLQAQQRKKDDQQAKINMEKQILREKLHQRREKKKRNESEEFLDDIFNAGKEND